jgi:hypothetical protein
MRSALESFHFYRRVPTDLSKGTPTGGLLSIFAAIIMAYLFFSDLALFFQAKWSHEVRVDQVYDHAIRVNFNITMKRMPCQYLSVDVFDVLGASVHNISTGIHRERVLADGERVKFNARKPIKSWRKLIANKRKSSASRPTEGASAINALAADELSANLRVLTSANFSTALREQPRALVLFGAEWCRWTRDMLPEWAAATRAVQREGLSDKLTVAYVDCARADSAQVCARHFVQAFPSVHVYERQALQMHQNYIGPRNAETLVEFARAAASARPSVGLATPFHPNLMHGESGNEGCLLVGSAFVARVPGSLRISARSEEPTTFNPRWIDMDHTIHTFTFGVPEERERRHHEREIKMITDAALRRSKHEGLHAEQEQEGGLSHTGEVRAPFALLPARTCASDGTAAPLSRSRAINANARAPRATTARPLALRCAPSSQGHFVHVEHLAFLPQYSRDSTVKPFRPSSRKSRLSRLVDNVEAWRIKQARVAHIHRHDTHGPNSLGNHSFVSQLPFVSIEHYIKVSAPSLAPFLRVSARHAPGQRGPRDAEAAAALAGGARRAARRLVLPLRTSHAPFALT